MPKALPIILERIKLLIKENLLLSILFGLGMILLSIGMIQSLTQKTEDVEFGNDQENTQTSSLLKVDVEGEVLKPGVYKLTVDSRVQDALIASGGLSQNADRVYVSKNLNLAQKLTDGMKIYIPQAGSSASIKESISLNTASLEELDKLPGIGKTTAQKIIEGRPYSLKEELVGRQILKEAVFNKIKDQISVD